MLNHFWGLSRVSSIAVLLTGIVAAGGWSQARAKEPGVPAVGERAKDFTLKTIEGKKLSLSQLNQDGPVVVAVLRGFPGYQCPACNAQAGDFLGNAKKFAAAGANVVLIYPGNADGLGRHAAEFVKGKTLLTNFQLVLDPDYEFAAAYALRWDAQGETVYPATFVIDSKGQIKFAKVSKTHGGRASAAEVLAELPAR